ncbi:hypothetical protein FQN49_000258 [Arthroderma sp. PD_2]|nr:hypothetical protein FQN49_000258 [Arthroderma sp. PD_2]
MQIRACTDEFQGMISGAKFSHPGAGQLDSLRWDEVQKGCEDALFGRTRSESMSGKVIALRRWIYLVSPVLSFLLVACYLFWPRGDSLFNPLYSSLEEFERRSLPGLKDVHVVLKTGATEALRKLPVHFSTTLRDVPRFTLFSDYEEDVGGFHLHDVLKSVDDDIKNEHPDFELYRRLRDTGRETLSPTWNKTIDESTPAGKPKNPGWVLDKWKFLPMMHETLQARDDAEWYVFIEADTYIVWPNLIGWLETFNASEPIFLGSQMKIGDIIFAHGGSGFALSRPALEQIVEYHSSRVDEWDTYTSHQWAGDAILGKALADSGINLTWSWPMFQGATPWTFDHLSASYNKLPWCYPPVAYHHMDPADIREFWRFEMTWSKEASKEQSGNSTFLHHSDVFQKLIRPLLAAKRTDWDNDSKDAVEGVKSAKECKQKCSEYPECLQYSYSSKGCHISKGLQAGITKPGVFSGWMAKRIDDAVAKLGSCEQTNWARR